MTRRVSPVDNYDAPAADADARKPWVRLTGYILAAIYIALVVAEIIWSVTSTAQDAAFIKQIGATPWVVPVDDADDYLYFTQLPGGVFSLYTFADQNFNSPVICFAVFFLLFYLWMAWKEPDMWINFLPLVFGILFFGGVDGIVVAAKVFHMTDNTTPLIQIDLAKKLLITDLGQKLPLCSSGIRLVEDRGGRSSGYTDVDILVAGVIATPATFRTDDPAEALMALIKQTAAAAGCPITDNAAWPDSNT